MNPQSFKNILIATAFCFSLGVNAQVTDAVLTTQAEVIRNEPTASGNTRARVADMLEAIINSKPNLLSTYANPAWISSLSFSKISSLPSTLAGYGITVPISIASGGTGLAALGTSLQSLRVNAGATALEWYTPSGGGITNAAAANEFMKSNGTNAVASGLFSTTAGDVDFGTGSSGSRRTLTATGSASDIDLYLVAKGSNGNITGNTGSSSSAFVLYPEHFYFGGINSTHVADMFGANNAVSNTLNLRKEISGATFTTGLGNGLIFETETADTNFEIGSSIQSVTTSITPGNEYFDFVIKTMGAGTLGESFRISQLAGPTTRLTVQGGSVDVASYGWAFNTNATASNFKVGIQESATIDRKLHTEEYSTATNTVLYPFRASRVVQSGNGATGVGVGMEFETENGSGANVVSATIESVATDVTAASEDSDLVFKTMAAGAAATEKFRVASDQTIASINSTLTNTRYQPFKISHTTSGTPANGIAVGIQFEQETSNNNNELAGVIDCVYTDVTGGSEDSDMVFSLQTAGGGTPSEKFRISSLGGVVGTTTNNSASTGIIGEEINSTISTYTNYTSTATYQNITSITLTAGDWDISAFITYSSNSATITAASNAIFVISTTTASASGATEGLNIGYIPQAALLGTSKFTDTIAPYRVSLSGTTTYYLNSQATFTVGNPQFVGSIRARRIR